jgi:membrane fusion protein (multidrug efflux system)
MKKISIVLVLAAVAAGIWLLARSHGGQAEKEPEVKPTAAVEVTTLQMHTISQTIAAFGVIEAAPAGAHSLGLGYDCTVVEVDASVGSRVEAGAILMKVAPTPDARMQLDSAKSTASLAQRLLARIRERFDLRLANSQDVLAAEQAAEDAKIKVSSFVSRGLGGDGLIKAAQGGVVTKLDWQPGATVAAGTPLVMITDVGQLMAHLTVESSDAGQVKADQVVSISSANRADADPLAATVQSVGASVDPTTGAVDVRVALPVDDSWFVGEHVRAAIEIQKKTALVAPRSAVLPDDNDQVLYTVKNNKATKHVVKLGIVAGDLVEVISKDLKVDDAAVSKGNYELEDGMAVQIIPKADTDKGSDDDDEEAKK